MTTPHRRPGLSDWFTAALLSALLGAACYEGPGPKEPPPGSPGGFCVAGQCNEPTSVCDPEGDYCYDKFNVCRGIFCGDHGECALVDAKPSCICDFGYTNEMYALYCEPAAGL